MTSLHCERALLPGGVAKQVRLTLEDDRIVGLDLDAAPRPGDDRLTGLVRPGFANGHSHAFHRALRGRTHHGGGTFWTWREEMYAVAGRLDPDSYQRFATAVFAEMVLAGYTVVGEFHYVHHDPAGRPYVDDAMERALLAAAATAGIRITLLDTLYLAGGLTADGHQPLAPEQARFGDGSVEHWAARVERLHRSTRDLAAARIGTAVHSVRAVPETEIAAAAIVARDHRMPLHVHLSEQPAENEACQAHHGCSPTELLHRAGALGAHATAVHATHLSAHDVSLLGRGHCFACFCPTTERDLADGIGPARALHDRGARLTLGSDQHAVIDPFEEIRGLELNERLHSRERGRFTLGELEDAASPAGYASLGWARGGAIEVGALADLVAVDLASVRTVGARPRQVGYAATASDVTDVLVGGRWVVRDRRHRLGTPEAIAHRLADGILTLRRNP